MHSLVEKSQPKVGSCRRILSCATEKNGTRTFDSSTPLEMLLFEIVFSYQQQISQETVTLVSDQNIICAFPPLILIIGSDETRGRYGLSAAGLAIFCQTEQRAAASPLLFTKLAVWYLMRVSGSRSSGNLFS